ncbi:MAG: hypothetical protein ACR2P0_05820, partial [Acidimicrobiales bacterium]
QQDVAALAFLPIATAFAFRTVGRRSVRRVFVNGRLLGGVLFATFAFFLFAAGSSLYNEPWSWGSRSSNDVDIVRAVESVGDDESVSALPAALPLLAEREVLIPFDTEVEAYFSRDPMFSSDVMIVDEADESWNPTSRATFDQIVAALGFDVTDRFGTISVYRLASG